MELSCHLFGVNVVCLEGPSSRFTVPGPVFLGPCVPVYIATCNMHARSNHMSGGQIRTVLACGNFSLSFSTILSEIIVYIL